jgi:4-hydroxybenzoate polyprenyltransferase
MVTLCGSILLSLLLAPSASPAAAGVYLAGALAGGIALLLVPAMRLVRSRERSAALQVFNRASYYPLWMLGLVLVSVGAQSLAAIS